MSENETKDENKDKESSSADEIVDELLASKEYLKLKDVYKDVVNQIKEKRHVAYGYIVHATTIPSIGEVVIKTLTKKERDLISVITAYSSTDTEAFKVEKSNLSSTLTLLFSIMKLEGVIDHESPIKPPKLSEFDTWIKSSAIASIVQNLESISEFVEELILTIITEIKTVTRLSMTEQLKNRQSPQAQ